MEYVGVANRSTLADYSLHAAFLESIPKNGVVSFVVWILFGYTTFSSLPIRHWLY